MGNDRCDVAPERWAKLARGEVSAAERQNLEALAASSSACRDARDAVFRSVAAMQSLRGVAPDMPWDLLERRGGWAVSAAHNVVSKPPGLRRFAVPAGFALAAAAVCVALLVMRPPTSQDAVAPAPLRPSVAVVSAVPPPAPTASRTIAVAVVQADPRASIDGAAFDPSVALRAGQVLKAQGGRLVFQFGPRSAVALEAGTTVILERLDSDEVRLRVDGNVSVDLTKRGPDERFVILAGRRRVEVRGTAFRVQANGDALDVAVARGRVAVSDEAASVEVAAGGQLRVPEGASLGSLTTGALSEIDLAGLVEAVAMPWAPSPEAIHTGALARVEVEAHAEQIVRLDGVSVGKGATWIWADPGRHLLQVGARATWVETKAGVPTKPVWDDPIVVRSERPGQVDSELRRHARALAVCGERLRKVGEGRRELVVEIGISREGAVRFVGPVSGIPETDVEDCVVDLIRARFEFPHGTAATVRPRIRL